MKYCGAINNGFGWQFTGSSHAEELHKLIFGRIGIRRVKENVLPELPPKQRIIVPFEITNEKEYKKAESNVINWIAENRGAESAEKAKEVEALAQLNVLKELAVKGKMEQVKEWITDFLDSGQKLVLFAVHHSVIDKLMNEFQSIAVKLDGRDNATSRNRSVQSFQNNKTIRLFIGNIKAAGVGLTLTAASNVAFVELGWSPGEHSQAEDRCHRIGQKADSITAYYLIADKTVEVEIASLLDRKQKILSKTLEGKEVDKESLLSTLIKQMRRNKN